jgi:hypothetical protein
VNQPLAAQAMPREESMEDHRPRLGFRKRRMSWLQRFITEVSHRKHQS